MLLWTSKCLSFILFLLILLPLDVRPCFCCWCLFPTLFPCCATRSTPVVKRRREIEVVLLESGLPPATAPLSMSKGGDGARASPA